MKDRDSILSAFLDGELPVAIFADWLEENGFSEAAEDVRANWQLSLVGRYSIIRQWLPDVPLPPIIWAGDYLIEDHRGQLRQITPEDPYPERGYFIAAETVLYGKPVKVFMPLLKKFDWENASMSFTLEMPTLSAAEAHVFFFRKSAP